MWWLLPILAVFYVVAVVLKLVFQEQLEEVSSLGLALRLFFFVLGVGVILLVLAFVFNW